MAEVKKELKNCRESKDAIISEYVKCEKELRVKTEEVEKFKLEVKDLRKIVKLRHQLKDKDNGDLPMDIQNDDNEDARNLLEMKKRGFKRHSPQTESTPTKAGGQKAEKMHTCIDCSFTGLNEMQLITHIASKHKAARANGKNKTEKDEFNCQECDFQGTTEIQVRKHYNLKHTMRGSDCREPIKCKICGDEFTEKLNIMMHRKTNHIGSVATCRNFENEICSYTSDACWWNHEEKRNCSANIQCYICGKSFEKKSDLMSHMKKNHIDLVQQCNKFMNAEC